MDSYQPIYDAVRSRISGGNISEAVADAIRIEAGSLSHAIAAVRDDMQFAAHQYQRPSAVWRPKLAKDGNAWIALYGDNLQEGVVGVGDSPEAAMGDFDKSWFAKATTPNT